MRSGSILRQENGQLLRRFADRVRRGPGREAGLSRPPAQTFYLIGENDAPDGTRGREPNLKGTALGAGGDGIEYLQAGFPVAALRAEDQSGSAAGLLTSGLGCEDQPDESPRSGA